MKHLKLLFSLLMDPFICLNQLFSWVFFEDEGHPVDTWQGLHKLQNNCSAKSGKIWQQRLFLSPPWSHSSADFLYFGQPGSESRSGFSNSSFSWRGIESCLLPMRKLKWVSPTDLSHPVQTIFQLVFISSWTSQMPIQQLKLPGSTSTGVFSITFLLIVSSIFPVTSTENFIPVFSCWWEIPNSLCVTFLNTASPSIQETEPLTFPLSKELFLQPWLKFCYSTTVYSKYCWKDHFLSMYLSPFTQLNELSFLY